MHSHARTLKINALTIAALLVVTCNAVSGQDKPAKLTERDLIANHLKSIAEPANLGSVKNQVIAGTTRAVFKRRGVSTIDGQALLASEGNKILFNLQFGATDYPFERIGYDGDKVRTTFVQPGVRSVLGDFFNTYTFLFKQGLIGGTLSTAWPLLEANNKGLKIDLKGKKKIEGREVYEVSYIPKGGADLSVSLYFAADTFEHLRSVYRRTQASRMGSSPNESARQQETRYTLTEDFSDFKKEGNLNLPHTYKIELSISGQQGALISEWTSQFSQFAFNQNIDTSGFKPETDATK